jgi:4-hydroxybenzoate polyprenyltransferase
LAVLAFNRFTIVLGVASLLVVAIYPFMKRLTDWPQFVLGLAFSWGALVGWSAIHGALSAAPLALYAGAVLWTIAYDTIYALQDREDDALIGIRSTARLFGARARAAVAMFYAAAFVLFGLAFWLAGAASIAFVGLAAAACHVVWIVTTLLPDDAANCLTRFRANTVTGWIIFAGLLLEAALPRG